MSTDEARLESTITSFPQQATIFGILNLFVIATLLLAHVLLAPYWGRLSPTLFVVLGAGFLFHSGMLTWIQARPPTTVSAKMVLLVTIASIGVNSVMTLVAAATNHERSQYFALMIVPVLEAAFRFSLAGTVLVVAIADSLTVFWIWEYYKLHPSKDFNEYLEAGTVCLIYTVVGIIVWLLVRHLQENEVRLARNIEELNLTRQRLLEEEKLAAIGRLSNSIAHEIRNPVAMISSSLSMATSNGLTKSERQEMFDIAAKEAARLEKLTGEFLAYARPQPINKAMSSASDTLLYVASACKAFASEKGVSLEVDVASDLNVNMDAAKVQQALLNLVKNAIEASQPQQSVTLHGLLSKERTIWFEVVNVGPAISKDVLQQIFEPFFTTKEGGAGLGLAIARNIARAHGGDLFLRVNEPGRVCFTLELPAKLATSENKGEKTWAAS
ncbi:MAG TPA: HAMP domain-containing sensor histidine kinase [Candidatus Acidoferrum sp.]|nr:HAMP domain-containing sensor histidine kinase [Candidatus Acidoferrum sp.]